jgi:CDP-glycerol glycerophosphotransferase (TagB/SpsB family)
MGNFRLNDPSVITPSDDIEVQQLILISDFIISDFSSIIFDGMAINIPFYLYINDFDLYEKARGVYADIYENLKPFCINDEEELIKRILSSENDYPVKNYEKAKMLYSNINENNSNQDLKAKIEFLLSE